MKKKLETIPTLVTATVLTLLLACPPVRANFSAQAPTTLTQCASANFWWDNSLGPYEAMLVNASDACGNVVQYLGQFASNSINVTLAIPVNWTVLLYVEDGLGEDAWSPPVVVQNSNDSSCLSPTNAAIAAGYVPPSNTNTNNNSSSNSSSSDGRGNAGAGHNGGDPLTHRLDLRAALLGGIGVIASAFLALVP